MKQILFLFAILYILTPSQCKHTKRSTELNNNNINNNKTSIAYIKTSIPTKIYRCMQRFNVFRCMKLFILQRMELNKNFANSGNLKADFLRKLLIEHNQGLYNIDEVYASISEKELNERLYICFQKFFNERDIKIHFIPGLKVKVLPSKRNIIDLALKKQHTTISGRKTKNYEYLLKIFLPIFLLPIIAFGSFLPMIIPIIKSTVLKTVIINHVAFFSALMYLARTAALDNEQKNTVFYNTGSGHH